VKASRSFPQTLASAAGRLLNRYSSYIFLSFNHLTYLKSRPFFSLMTTTQPGKKKALLIGINYENNDELCLSGPHQDVVALKKLLQEIYEYEDENIVVMLDGKGHDSLEPTNVNILREINNLVCDAQPGDHFLFYYSGHSEQIINLDHTEEDDLDEVLVPCDQKIIIDNQLRKCLVDPLPIGSSLVVRLYCHFYS
jgi:hypothetical protein